jgi:hypothetical protein
MQNTNADRCDVGNVKRGEKAVMQGPFATKPRRCGKFGDHAKGA